LFSMLRLYARMALSTEEAIFAAQDGF